MISLVIPVFNERESILPLWGELQATFESIEHDFEVIFVDDGSHDGTGEELQKLSESFSGIRVISFRRNSGKSLVYNSGFMECKGDIVVTMDGDLQDVPGELSGLLAKVEEGFDLVVGWKQARFANEPAKAFPSFFFNLLLGLIFGLRLHDSNCGFRAIRRHVLPCLNLRGDLYRFIPQIAHMNGFKVTEVPVKHRKRKYGSSKYGPLRFWTGLLDVLTLRFVSRFFDRPLHFFGSLGLVPLTLGIMLEIYALTMKLILGSNFQSHIAAIVIGVLLIMSGTQAILTGLVGEMIQYSKSQN